VENDSIRSFASHPLALVALLAVVGCAPRSERATPSAADSAAARALASGRLRGVVPARPTPKPDFALVDTQGRVYDFRRETDGKLAFLFFGYTHCPDICPIHLANLGSALSRLPRAEADRVRVVFVTTDPVRDTPERMRRFLDAFDPSFVGLTGTKAALEHAQREAGVTPTVAQPAPGDTGYAVGHAAQVIAYGPDGTMRAQYPFGTRQKDWAHDLPILLGLVGADGGGAAGGVTGGFARVMPTKDVGAAYFTLVHVGRPDTLLGATVEHATNVEIHTIVRDGGLARMVPRGPVPLAAGDTLRLSEGGDHLMFDLERGSPAADAEHIDVVLRFAHRAPLALRLPVRAYGSEP